MRLFGVRGSLGSDPIFMIVLPASSVIRLVSMSSAVGMYTMLTAGKSISYTKQ